MKLIKCVVVLFIINLNLYSSEKINLNFQDMNIMELVKITSKIIHKNILITENVPGKLNFISNKEVYPKDLLLILEYALRQKGFVIVDNKDMLRIVKLSNASKNNLPILNGSLKKSYFMVTKVINVNNMSVDLLASKIRYLLSRDGKLMTNKESNDFVITDFKDNVETIKRITDIITNSAKKQVVAVRLKNIKASDAKKSLDTLAKSVFDEKVITEKVDIIDNKDNTLLLVGKKANIRYLKKYILNIDKNGLTVKTEIKVFPLKNVEAKNVIKIINEIIGKKKYENYIDKPLSSVDEETNSIIIMGPSDEIKYVSELIKKLDKEKAQVYVQARIIQADDERINQIGVSYGIFGGKSSSNGLATFSANLNGGSDSLANVKNLLGLNIPNITSGLALGASLNLLKQDGAIDIVSQPSILAVNNKESSIYVGETISVKKSSSVGSDGITTNSTFDREDVGLKLKVKPRISNDDKVTLDIGVSLEGVKTTKTSSGNADTSKKEINTTAILNNGESVIIGGLIEDRSERTKQKVPVLGDIPIIGNVFKNNSTNNKKNNLVIIVTPYLIPKSKDITYVRDKLAKLKNLENEYLKNSLVRLKKEEIIKKEKERKRNEKLKELDKKLDELNGKTKKKDTFAKQDKMMKMLYGKHDDEF